MRRDWKDLPDAVTAEIAARLGRVHVVPATDGDHAEIAATLSGPHGKVFVKAACSEAGVRSLRYELRVSETVDRSYSPAVRWQFDAAGWLVVAFEHLPGRHADLSPGSPDLDLLGETLKTLGETSAPGLPMLSPAARLGFSHPAMDGATLVHTDLTPTNLVVTPRGLVLVDWAMATRAAPWVELALLAQWLIGSGHTPAQAEAWLAQCPAWGATDPAVLDDFARRNASKWAFKAQQGGTGWMHDLAAWTGQWSEHWHQKVAT